MWCSLLCRYVVDYYERRRRDITATDRRLDAAASRPAVRITDRSCCSSRSCCHGNDRRERRPALVRQLGRRRTGLLKRVHHADLSNTNIRTHSHAIIRICHSRSAITSRSSSCSIARVKDIHWKATGIHGNGDGGDPFPRNHREIRWNGYILLREYLGVELDLREYRGGCFRRRAIIRF